MPEYRMEHHTLNIIQAQTMLLDTNVLVAAFYEREAMGRREYAWYILEQSDRPLLIPTVVVVEAWGMLVGSLGDYDGAIQLLTWLNQPGRATIVSTIQGDLLFTQQLIQGIRIDCVDAMLAELATSISESCDLRPALTIATFDTRDFTRMRRSHGLRLSIFDMNSLDEWEIT